MTLTLTNKQTRLAYIMKELDLERAVCQYDGGNDEGFVHSPMLTKSDGSFRHGADYEMVGYQEWDDEKRRWVQKERPATREQKLEAELHQIMSEPIYDRYGSFAGNFSCYGTVEVLRDGTMTIDGSESLEVWESAWD